MSDWAAKVLEGVPRHNAQDAKSMTGYAAAVWLHEDAVVDAIARMGAGDDDALVALLRAGPEVVYRYVDTDHTAADRIVALTAQNRQMALDVLASSGQAADAYAAQLAAEAERDALNAKVARLEGALRIIGGNSCITCSAEAFNVLFAERHPSAALTDGDKHA